MPSYFGIEVLRVGYVFNLLVRLVERTPCEKVGAAPW